MKCTKCGKELADSLAICPQCNNKSAKIDNGYLENSNKESYKDPKSSRLLEFPTTSRQSPDWRAELSERVRQVRERRNLQEARGRLQAELQAATERYQQPSAPVAVETKESKPSAGDADAQHLNPIIEAALRRAQRASEVVGQRQSYYSNLATAPKLAPSTRPNNSNIALASVRSPVESANLALAPEVALSSAKTSTTKTSGKVKLAGEANVEDFLPPNSPTASTVTNLPGPNAKADLPITNSLGITNSNNSLRLETASELVVSKPNVTDRNALTSLNVAAEVRGPRSGGLTTATAAAAVAIAVETPPIALPVTPPLTEPLPVSEKPVRVIKESDTGPDYLDELVALCDQNLAADYPNYYQQAMAIAVDLIVCLLASSPFWVVTYVFEADLQNYQILLTLCGITILLSVIYHTFTIFVLARTFGMMFVGTHVVNNDTTAAPSLLQSLVRGIGFVFSTLVLGLGFLWMFVDREHRGLPDVVSNTTVVRDY